MEEFDIQGIPTLVILNRQGEEIKKERVAGYLGSEEFLEKLQHIGGLMAP
jgi:thioredoxin-related protein